MVDQTAPSPAPSPFEVRLSTAEAKIEAIEKALASVIAPQVSQSEHDGLKGAIEWLKEKFHLVQPKLDPTDFSDDIPMADAGDQKP